MGVSTVSAQQSAARSGALVVTPSVSVTETITDNALLSSTQRQSDAVTVLTAGVSVSGRGGRVQGSLDYQLTGSIHARSSEGNTTGNSLRAKLNAELVENFFFLDANASIGQQTISAFGVQTADPAFDSPNRTEVRSYSISPSVRGRVGTWALFNAMYLRSQQSSGTGQVGDSISDNASVSLTSEGRSRIGWGLVASRQRSDFSAGRAATTDSVQANASYSLLPELRLTASGGREKSNVLTGDAAGTGPVTTWGVGLDWNPSSRTSVSLRRNHRYFGESYAVNIDFRAPRSNWRLSSSRDVTTASPTFVNTGAITLYDLLFANLAATVPDPIARREIVLQQLARDGSNPNATIGTTGFLNSAVMLVNRHELSFSLQGLRTTATFSAYRSDSRRIDSASNAIDDLSNGGNVRQRGFTMSLSHRLTPVSGLSLTLAQQRTLGSTAAQANDLQSINLSWNSEFTRRGTVSLGARHVEFDSTVQPYTESALFATVSVSF